MPVFQLQYSGGSPTSAEVHATLTAWAAYLNGQLTSSDNLDPSFSMDVTSVAHAADTRGYTMTGNIGMGAGNTIDGVDVSELNNSVSLIQNSISTSTIVSDKIVVLTGTIADGASLATIHAGYPSSDWTAYYNVGLGSVNGAGAGYPEFKCSGITCTETAGVISCYVTDYLGNTVAGTANYTIILIKK